MKRIAFPLLATVAVSLAPLTYAQQTEPTPAPAADPPAMASDMHASAASTNTRLAALVPAGLTPEDACRGFKDVAECSAALHLAQNLNIPFADLKDRVTSGQSLGTAIHALKPKADSRHEVQRAEEQARADLRSQG